MFEEWLETHRRVYNYAVSERKDWYKSRSCRLNACSLHSCYIIPADAPRPTFASQCKSLTVARKESEYLKRVNAQSLQQTLRRLEKHEREYVGKESWVPKIQEAGKNAVFLFSTIR